MKRGLFIAAALAGSLACAQTFQWPENYAPTANEGGTINEVVFSDFLTFNPVLISSSTEQAILGMVAGPDLIYRDWIGNRSFRKEDNSFNTVQAASIEEVQPEQEFVITLKEGWNWSDGTEITADDYIAARTIIGDADVQSNEFASTVVGDNQEPITYEKLGKYKFRVTAPEAKVNLMFNVASIGAVPSHIFMPVYKDKGAEGILALWGVDTPVKQLVSGGPYMITEFRPGERIVMSKNPEYGKNVQAADGSALPGPNAWTVDFVADRNAQVALVTTGQANFDWPQTVDDVRAVQQAVQNGSIGGTFFPNIGPDTLVDFITYNFQKKNECKRNMFKTPEFRQAIAIMIDRQALIQAALGGLGFPAKDYNSSAAKPFDAPNLQPFEFNPEQGVQMLNDIGFTETGQDGVLMNPDTGCRVAFDLQFNSGNNRRGQEAQVISQTLAQYGVRANPREVSTEIWSDSITGTQAEGTKVDYDAQIWGLGGGDVDNPSSVNVVGLGQNLNSWNKSTTNVEPWEISMDRLSRRMDRTLDLDERVAVYNERAELMRKYLPMTPLISPAFSFYGNMGNIWPEEALDANSIASPYTPGGYRSNLTAPQ